MRKQQGADCQTSDKVARHRWPSSNGEGCPAQCQSLSPSGGREGLEKEGKAGSGGRAFCKLSATLSHVLFLPPRIGLSGVNQGFLFLTYPSSYEKRIEM